MVRETASRDLTALAEAIAVKELELATLGYPEKQIRAAIRWCVNRADGVAGKARPELRLDAFTSTLEENLEAAERWLQGNALAAADRDMERGVDRAVAEGKTERGYRRMGLDGGAAARRWEEGAEASKQRYGEFFSPPP